MSPYWLNASNGMFHDKKNSWFFGTKNGVPYYVGRGWFKGSLMLGKISADWGGKFYFCHNGKKQEFSLNNCQVDPKIAIFE